MGASGWGYREKFQDDIATTFAALQAVTFDGSEYNEHCATLEDLWADEEFMETIGTHSILDIYRLVAPETPRDRLYYNNMRPLTDDELMAAFECPRPTLATFQEAEDAGRLPFDGRWNGCCAVIYKGGKPDEVAFWGYSGD
ncbi:hypothetical protein GCM10009839_06660 [Catenulispora yoronensis]|uniref:Uncharacterized protein n=1 Tax=Catenulispora yoronensis TaxID=450799 RepID=A0ABN2TM95_9ACTN